MATCLFQALDEILSFASDFDFDSKLNSGCCSECLIRLNEMLIQVYENFKLAFLILRISIHMHVHTFCIFIKLF